MVAMLGPKWTPPVVGAFIFVTMVAVTACRSSDSHTPTKTVAPPSPSRSPLSDQDAITSAYRNLYVVGQRAEQASPEQRRSVLATVATQPLLDRMLRGIAALQATGRATWGMPVHHTFDVKINGDKATLHDCQDATKTGQADAKTGRRLTHGMTGTHLVVSFRKGKDGAWRASTLEQVDDSCSPAD
jgi:hypothetical protein